MKTPLVMTVAVLVAIAVWISLPPTTSASGHRAAQKTYGAGLQHSRRPPKRNQVEVVWKGRKFRRGDRIRVTSWAGTIKPDESGHPAELNVDAGHTGTVIRGEKRQPTSYFTPDPNEPIQIMRIKWDKQKWTENPTRKIVELDEFESTIHADYLGVIKRRRS